MQLAVAQQADRGRRRRVAGEVLARAVGGLDVGAGKDGRQHVGPVLVLQRLRDAGPRLAGGAAAHRIHDQHHDAAAVLHDVVHRRSRPQLAARPCRSFRRASARSDIRDMAFGLSFVGIPSVRYFFSISSRFALNSLPGFHSGSLSALRHAVADREQQLRVLDARRSDPSPASPRPTARGSRCSVYSSRFFLP